MKRKVFAILASFAMMLGLAVSTAGPANAINWNIVMGCSTSNGFQFENKAVLQSNGSNTYWELPNLHQGYLNPGWLGLEWRTRIYRNGTLVFDTGYNTNPNINYVRFSASPKQKGYSYRLQMNVGRLSDGLATCENNYYWS